MKGQDGDFRFKQFTISHSRSSMKVGVDGVLIGAWGTVQGNKGLDIGCGCGLIALMAAQRNSIAEIEAIDIHQDSVSETQLNFSNSPWHKRLTARLAEANTFATEPVNRLRFDFIISNPPFYDSGLISPSSTRERARHISLLSPYRLLELSETLLSEGGTVSIIMPHSVQIELEIPSKLTILRKCYVADRPSKQPKRVMMSLTKGPQQVYQEEKLYVRNEDGEYSEEYKRLTGDFYLAF